MPRKENLRIRHIRALPLLCLGLLSFFCSFVPVTAQQTTSPVPLVSKNHPVDWWFLFKFNTASFPGCAGGAQRSCPFGGQVQKYKGGQQFVFASSDNATLQQGSDCAGDTTADPIGATFDQVYNHTYFYLVWNDQFYDDPKVAGCSKSCGAPWGHSKGILAWGDSGDGFILQVSTPSWPGSGSANSPRRLDGNTLGCVKDNNVKVSQHMFALRLSKADLLKVLSALQNASVATDVANPELVHNGGPFDVQALVKTLGTKSTNTAFIREDLSSGVVLISKPSRLHVPPWQMVSAILGGVSLRTTSWWTKPKIPTTTPSMKMSCWDSSLGKPGTVEIATSGRFGSTNFGLTGGGGNDKNHAKFAVSLSGDHHYAIFGDMNQQGDISGKNCSSSQNGRGGLFFVIDDTTLFNGLTDLSTGGTAPTK
jgi:hypothetical protein